MKQKKGISTRYNMSFGLLPVIVCMMLSLLMKDNYALYLSSTVGILYGLSTFLFIPRTYNFILYASTSGLILLALSTLAPLPVFPAGTLPFTLEIVTFILAGILLYAQSFLKKTLKKDNPEKKFLFIEHDLNSSLVSARIIFTASALHFVFVTVLFLLSVPLTFTTSRILFQYCPPLLYLLCIAINQGGIRYANRFFEKEESIPIVNKQGDVIGKQPEAEATMLKDQITPVIRIAIVYKRMLLLVNKKCTCTTKESRTDIPLESYLKFGETLENGLQRILNQAYPKGTTLIPRFSIKHYYHTNDCNRLIYLYLAYAEEESAIHTPAFKNAKLWTLKQIEQNLGTGYFCDCFEEEFDHLESAVTIWEEFH